MKRKYVELWVAVDGKEFTSKEECDNYEREKGFIHKYEVTIFYSGSFYTRVEATSEEEAIQKAREEMDSSSLDWEEDDYTITSYGE